MRSTVSHLLAILAIMFLAHALRGEDLNLPPEKIEGGAPNQMMHRYLLREGGKAAERWRADYENRKTPEDIAAYQKRLREAFLNAIGGLPERTPLEPQVVGTVARPGYRVEKVIFQSQPKHYVTALLFMPEAELFKPPYPGVIVPCGHTFPAKGHPEYQTVGALLALNGMVAFVFDPIDQGERGQYLGAGGWPKLWGCLGHTMVGLGCVLLGRNTARFEIWDGMRAIDYLQSRPEIDPKRIGCAGQSGGGTQTSYLMALDDRIRAAAPSCCITNLLHIGLGGSDSEQNIFGQVVIGLDHPDLLMMRAPSPVLICGATHDFFNIHGAWLTARYAKRLYTRLGFAERLDILENDAEHNFDRLHREGVARWMARWLLGVDRLIVEPPVELLNEEEYSCLPDSRVMSIAGARSVYDLNEDYENELAKHRAEVWATNDRQAWLQEVRRLTGVHRLADLPEPAVETLETIARPGYAIEKLLIKPEPGITLPALLFLPEKHDHQRVVLWVHEEGKAVDAAPGGEIERRVLAGDSVLAVDIRGIGQTRPGDRQGLFWSADYGDFVTAYLLGRSYVGMRTEDILVCTRYAANRLAGGRAGVVQLVATGNVGVPTLHAAALEPDCLRSVRLKRTLASWAGVVHGRLHKGLETNVVHGALTHYDLPNLADSLADKIVIEQPVDALGAAIGEKQ